MEIDKLLNNSLSPSRINDRPNLSVDYSLNINSKQNTLLNSPKITSQEIKSTKKIEKYFNFMNWTRKIEELMKAKEIFKDDFKRKKEFEIIEKYFDYNNSVINTIIITITNIKLLIISITNKI